MRNHTLPAQRHFDTIYISCNNQKQQQQWNPADSDENERQLPFFRVYMSVFNFQCAQQIYSTK